MITYILKEMEMKTKKMWKITKQQEFLVPMEEGETQEMAIESLGDVNRNVECFQSSWTDVELVDVEV